MKKITDVKSRLVSAIAASILIVSAIGSNAAMNNHLKNEEQFDTEPSITEETEAVVEDEDVIPEETEADIEVDETEAVTDETNIIVENPVDISDEELDEISEVYPDGFVVDTETGEVSSLDSNACGINDEPFSPEYTVEINPRPTNLDEVAKQYISEGEYVSDYYISILDNDNKIEKRFYTVDIIDDNNGNNTYCESVAIIGKDDWNACMEAFDGSIKFERTDYGYYGYFEIYNQGNRKAYDEYYYYNDTGVLYMNHVNGGLGAG